MFKLKQNNGITGIDIIISVIIIAVFISLISTLVYTINSNSIKLDKKNLATSYVIDEIEEIKAQGYINLYEDKGLDEANVPEKIEELTKDIMENGEFTGFTKEVFIKDMILEDMTKFPNVVKKITVKISFNFRGEIIEIPVSTYIDNSKE